MEVGSFMLTIKTSLLCILENNYTEISDKSFEHKKIIEDLNHALYHKTVLFIYG